MATRTDKVYIYQDQFGFVNEVTSNVKKMYLLIESRLHDNGITYAKLLAELREQSYISWGDGDEKRKITCRWVQ